MNTTPSSAAERFDALESVPEKMRLVHLAASLFAEKLKEDVNVVMVTSGYRTKRSAPDAHHLLREPCVVIVVRHKWPASADASNRNRTALAERLLVESGKAGRRAQYGVPTDIQPLDWFQESIAHRDNGIEMNVAGTPDGAIACAVQVDTPANKYWLALSALHVLTPNTPVDQPSMGGEEILFLSHGGSVGTSTQWSGMLLSDGISFDAQLADVDRNWLNRVFAANKLGRRPYLRSRSELDAVAPYSTFMVLVPANHAKYVDSPRVPVTGQFDVYANADSTISYLVSKNGMTFHQSIQHEELVVVAAGAGNPVSEPGDSGSPVVVIRDGEMVLVGILIAGPPLGSSADRMYVLPAWQLFDVAAWGGALPPGTTRLTPSFSIP